MVMLTSTVRGYTQDSWREVVTIKDFCNVYPGKARAILDHLNLDHKGLEKVKTAMKSGNQVLALHQLLEYYRNKPIASHLRKKQPRPTNRTVALADTLLTNTFVVQQVKGTVPWKKDGHRDWLFTGPNNDREWAWLSNRHKQLDSVREVYFRTGNVKYARYIDMFLRDFIIASWPYPGKQEWGLVWRGLEVSFRAKVWTRIFYNFTDSEHISPATKLLMLYSLPDHAHYNRNFHLGGNWLTMELSGLATVATYFPEFKMADQWMGYAIKTMSHSIQEQVYPDGAQKELTSHYHTVALRNFIEFKNICDDAKVKLPEPFSDNIRKMYDYTAKTMRPDGGRVLNNDGDRGNDRAFVLEGAEEFDRRDWRYVATNGERGEPPGKVPSCFYPWAGHLISRSDYGTDAHWSFFDVGPWGSTHQHNDKLHISVAGYGRDLLVDAGRFAYTGEVAKKYRPYALSSFGHNVVIIDDKGQDEYTAVAGRPVDTRHYRVAAEYDYASGTMNNFKGLEGRAGHTRAVMYVRDAFWVVVDHITTDRPREIDVLWHWHPTCKVKKEGKIVKTNNPRGNLAIFQVSDQDFGIRLIKGEENPVQGWYSPEYNVYEPNITTDYNTRIDDATIFVWLLVPSAYTTPGVKSRLLAATDEEVTLSVRIDRKEWKLLIPFTNAANIRFSVK